VAFLTAIAGKCRTAHGLSPVLAILDEVVQVRGPQSGFIDATTMSQGANSEPLLLIISTQADHQHAGCYRRRPALNVG
jgi:phage terminase large subunit-like protein